MRRRRIFRPSAPRRFGGAFAVTGTALLGGALVALGLPSDLLGSAPRNQEWRATAPEIRVVDGDTLRLGDRTLRLYGVDAPERGQRCTDVQGQLYDCGTTAAAALAQLVADRAVDCRLYGRDRFGRALGVCRAGGVELNASMVAAGWALADGSSLPALVPIEGTARIAQRGLWAGGFEPPAHWRRGH
ncbi:MAG: thermonuclease family protein [Acetobacteraceae bacterium]|nr:thermonuclease family protein [Acetobacteraceae bacterium]